MEDTNELTIADIARAAGFSTSTVSRIINGKQDVAQMTSERVQRVIAELGYTPHVQAQRLRAGKSRSIAVLFSLKCPGNIPYNPLEMDFIVGAAEAAGDQNYLFNLLTSKVAKQSLLNFVAAHRWMGWC